MAFGLTQWLISFAIFLAVLTIITWSAVHLGKKNQNFIDANQKFFDVDDYSIEGKNKSLYSTIVRNSMSRVTEGTDGLTLFANEQGSEIPDSEEFYKILQSFYSTKSSVFNNSNYDTATTTFASSVIKNDSKRNYDITITLSNTSDKTRQTFVLDDRQHDNEKITILPNHISQTTHSTHLTYKMKLFDNTNRSWESDLNQSARTEFTEFHQNE